MNNPIQVLPKITVLSPEAIAQVHASSLIILSEIGIRVDSAKAIKVFKKAQGVKFLDDKRLTYKRKQLNGL
jgi:trimethylamine:corrinoid methyltransferase-like protein